MRGDAPLQKCTECGQPYPKDAEHALRGFGWLDNLPRGVTGSDIDHAIHDGSYRGDRFLFLETKRPSERVRPGQERLLRALAGLAPERLGVRLLRGTETAFRVHTVRAAGIDTEGVPTTSGRFRSAVASWLNGSTWREAEASLRVEDQHVCQWARDAEGAWHCVICGTGWGVSA